MIDCEKISKSILFNCENTPVTGTRNLYVANFCDIAGYSKNTDNVVTGVVLREGKCFFKIEGVNNSIMPSYTMIDGTFKMYDHLIKCVAWKNDPETKLNLERARSGMVVCIVENVYEGVDGVSSFEIYGLNSGLVFRALQRNANNTDTNGLIEIEFFTEKIKETFMPYFFSIGLATETRQFLENCEYLIYQNKEPVFFQDNSIILYQ